VAPVFPFGHGLSYTTFRYDSLSVVRHESDIWDAKRDDPIADVAVTVTNTGARDGAEVVQLYITFPGEASEPTQLKAFAKIPVAAGQSATATLTLTARDFSIWHPHIHTWHISPGTYLLLAGASSADLKLVHSIHLYRNKPKF
jgi:beta-glucosidase